MFVSRCRIPIVFRHFSPTLFAFSVVLSLFYVSSFLSLLSQSSFLLLTSLLYICLSMSLFPLLRSLLCICLSLKFPHCISSILSDLASYLPDFVVCLLSLSFFFFLM